jgi:hypothetical protein
MAITGGWRTMAEEAGRPTANVVLWWLCLVVAPLILVTIELFHPAGFTHTPGMWSYLSEPQPYSPAHYALAYTGPHWWFALHMIQTPLAGLVAVGLILMVKDLSSGSGSMVAILAWLARIAAFVMLVYMTALDAIGGFGLGRYIIVTQEMAAAGQLSPDQVGGVKTLLDAMWVDPWVGGQGSFTSLTASWASFFAALFVALALLLGRRAPVIPLLILVAFGWTLQISHAAFHGPAAFGLLAVAAIWIWFRGGATSHRLY